MVEYKMKKLEYILLAVLIGVIFSALSYIHVYAAEPEVTVGAEPGVVITGVMDDASRAFPISSDGVLFGPGINVNKDEDLKLREVPVAYEYLEEIVSENPYETLNISEAEFEELRWVVALEAQGEGFHGECAVIEAIFNRALSTKNWGDTIHAVLAKKGQFSTYKYIGSKKAWAKPGEMEDDAISEVLRSGPSILPSMKYVYFDSKGGVNGRHHVKIGKHTFGAEA